MGKANRVAIVVDSAASLPADAAERAGLFVVPMQLVIDGRTYLDGQELTPTSFYRTQREISRPPSTSSPTPGAFIDAFRTAALEFTSVLCLTVSPRFSMCHDSARSAIEAASRSLPLIEVHLVDSESAAGGEGLIAMEAWRAAQSGAEMEAVLEAARSVIPRVSLLAFLDTLYYLWKGGRVPMVAHAGNSILGIKPIFELSNGEVRKLARPRTRRRAMERMLALMKKRVGPGPLHATVMHADSREDAELMRERIEADFTCNELFVSEFSPVMGAHTGPGLLGIAFWSEP